MLIFKAAFIYEFCTLYNERDCLILEFAHCSFIYLQKNYVVTLMQHVVVLSFISGCICIIIQKRLHLPAWLTQ